MNYNTLCLSGGGLLCLSFLGTIDILEKNNFNLSLITHFIGTSIGSILSFFYSIGYSTEEIKQFSLEFNFSILERDIELDNLINNFGLNDGNTFVLVFKHFLKEKLDVTDITFIELFKITNKKLSIIGVNFTNNNEELFNYILTPNMSVITAIRISMSIPLVFTPVFYNDCYYIDGCFLNGFPINHCNIETTLGIYIKKNNPVSNNQLDLVSFLRNCLNLLANSTCQKNLNNYLSSNIITIESDSNEIDFEINKENKQKLINKGIVAAELFLKNQSYNICNNIIMNLINNII